MFDECLWKCEKTPQCNAIALNKTTCSVKNEGSQIAFISINIQNLNFYKSCSKIDNRCMV